MAIDDLLPGHALFFEPLQVLHQVADGKVSRVTLAVVAVLFAGLESAHVGCGDGLGAVAQAFEGAVHQLFVLPGEAAEEQRGGGALVFGERLLGGPLEMMKLGCGKPVFALEASALLGETLLDDVLDRRPDLHQVSGRHDLGFSNLSAHRGASFPV